MASTVRDFASFGEHVTRKYSKQTRPPPRGERPVAFFYKFLYSHEMDGRFLVSAGRYDLLSIFFLRKLELPK